MPNIRTQFDEPKRYFTEPGNRFITEYQEEISKDGTIKVVPTGKRNVYEMIQANLEDTKIENILKRVAMGDLSALQQKEAFYVDATEMPKTLMEVQNIVVKAKGEFEKFPTEVKELFDNSAEKYVSEMGTKEFLEKMAPYNQKIADIKEAGNLKAYNKKVADQAKFEKDVAAAKGGTTE